MCTFRCDEKKTLEGLVVDMSVLVNFDDDDQYFVFTNKIENRNRKKGRIFYILFTVFYLQIKKEGYSIIIVIFWLL